ncbi:MAG: biotin/lipoyl-containing protein, partial [Gammaproteobacteria bacterium]
MATEVLMPRQGQSVESCIIIEWKVTEGDTVTEGQPVCDIETDKAAFEVEAPVSGTVLGIFYPADADVEVLKVIAAIGEPGEDISALRPADEAHVSEVEQDADAEKEETTEAAAQTHAPGPEVESAATGASPRAKNLATEKDIDISGISGTGPRGRVIERDVVAAKFAAVSPIARAKAAAEGLAVPGLGSGVGGRVLA